MRRTILGNLVVAVAMGVGVSVCVAQQPQPRNMAKPGVGAVVAGGETSVSGKMHEVLIAQTRYQDVQAPSVGYELVVEDKSLLKPATYLERVGNITGSASGPALLQGVNLPMSEFAEQLAKVLGVPVVDATHLTGGYDYKLIWRPNDPAAVTDAKQRGMRNVEKLPSIFKALRDQLGLRLESRQVTVVDGGDRPANGY